MMKFNEASIPDDSNEFNRLSERSMSSPNITRWQMFAGPLLGRVRHRRQTAVRPGATS